MTVLLPVPPAECFTSRFSCFMWVQVAHSQQDTGGVKSGKFWWLLVHLRILTPIKVTKPVTPEVTCQ